MKRYMIVTVAVALVLVALVLVALQPQPNAIAAPAAAPTPVAGTYTGGTLAKTLILYNSAIATSTAQNSSGASIVTGDRMDVQYIIDQSATNTTTVKLQFSNNNTNWVDGPTIVSGNTTDANVMQQYNVFGAFARVNIAPTTSDPVTVTVIGVLK